jgi:hypothetical protein
VREADLIVPLRLVELVVLHVAPGFNRWLDSLDDPRVADRCTYPLRHVLWVGLLMFLCGMKSRYQLIKSGNRVGFHGNLMALAGCSDAAACHSGTLNHLAVHMAPSELLGLNARLARRIIDMRCFETSAKGTTTRWAWLTSFRPAHYNIEQLADKGGRLRWKIENEAFNLLKNGQTGLKHDYGSVGNAWYNYYLLAQIALLIIQLIWHGDIVRKVTDHAYETARKMFGSIRNLVELLKESLQRDRLAEVDDGFDPAAIQIRFNTS